MNTQKRVPQFGHKVKPCILCKLGWPLVIQPRDNNGNPWHMGGYRCSRYPDWQPPATAAASEDAAGA